GILNYLLREGKSTGEQLDDLLNTKSGLLGISGISGDMRQIVAAMKDGNPRATLAFEIFVHRLQAGIGAMTAVLGGIDALVFTAGIGENSPEVRVAACANFGFLGLILDAAKNARPSADQDISLSDSAVRVLVVRPAMSIRRSAMRPMPSRLDGVSGTASLRTMCGAATIVITSMIGASKSSRILVPSRGAAHRMRMGPSMNPAPKTTAK